MAVSFVGAGTIAEDLTGAGSVVPGPPTHTTNDIIIAVAWNEGGSKPTTATIGWTEIATIAGTNDVTWFWIRAAAAGTTGPTITSADSDLFAICYIIRGCKTTGTPYVDATLSGDGGTTDTTPNTALITTTNVNQFAMAFMAAADDTSFASGFPTTGWEEGDSAVVSGGGTDAGFWTIGRTVAVAGDVAAVVIGTWSTGLAYGCLTLAFIPQPVAVITGTFVPSATEGEVVTGGDTSIITLTDENWIAAGIGSFDLQRQNIINGHNSAQSEALGWNLVPRATQNITGVVRTSDIVVTTTWDASPTYDITATETITVTVPASAVVGNTTIVATPTFQVIAAGAAGGSTPKGFMTTNSFFWGS